MKAFYIALKGLKHLFTEEPHGRFHLFAMILTTALGFALKIQVNEWIAVLFCFSLVISLEAINTALEVLLDKLHPEKNSKIGLSKDLAAGGVLFASFISAIVGLIIFLPKIYSTWTTLKF